MYKPCVAFCFVLVLFQFKVIVTITGNQLDTSGMPPVNETLYWENICHFQKNNLNLTVKCEISQNSSFSFKRFRMWINRFVANSIDLSVHCIQGSSVAIPWPFRLNHLVSLEVHGCILDDFLSEITNSTLSSNSESLKIVKIVDSVLKINTQQLQVVTSKLMRFSVDFDCGPSNVEVYVWRNVSVKFDEHIDIEKRLFHPKQPCQYSKCLYFENSYSRGKTKLDLQIFSGKIILPNVKVLNYTHSDYVDIPADLKSWRLGFPKLQTLDMRYNQISGFKLLDYTQYQYNLSRGFIDLQYNNITTLGNNEIKTSRTNLNTTLINIQNNNFNCACDSIGVFVDFLQKFKSPKEAGLDQRYDYLWNLTCFLPKDVKNRVISLLTRDILCNTDTPGEYVALICSMSIFVVILILVIVLSSKYRKEIRILVFTRLYILLPCQRNVEQASKSHDVFISYNSKNADWVIETLLPGLEGTESGFNFNVCIRDRDCLAGASSSEQIVSCIENSHHTLVVVSSQFLKCEWNILEFKTAFNQSLEEKNKHLIIVLLENVPLSEVDPDLKRCLLTMTYITADDGLFWDRIRYAISHKSQYQKQVRGKHKVTTTEC